MSRVVLFDVDGVLVHGYHVRPERQVRWDETLEADLGVNPQRFREAFIHQDFVKHVLVGRMSLLEGLERALPGLGYRGPALAFARYWLEKDSNLNRPLLDIARQLQAAGARLFVATNQEHLRAQWLWRNLGLSECFEDMFHSARVGALKPTRPYLDWIDNRLGPYAAPPILVDDRPDVVAAARAHGWEAIEYDDLPDVTGHPVLRDLLAIANRR